MFGVAYFVFQALAHVAQDFVGLYKFAALPLNGESFLILLLACALFNRYCGHVQTPYRKAFGF